jgi:hypothetical protein
MNTAWVSKRVLLGCIAALGTMLVFELAVTLSGRALDLPLQSALGSIPVGTLLVTFGAMLLGGWIARRRFRWVALGLTAALWLTVVATLVAVAEPPMDSPGAVLRFNAAAIALSLVAAWCGALAGERLGARPVSAPA